MSTTIDRRVVEMQFDNRHFEKNIETSMSTLDKLKEKLSFNGLTKNAQSEFSSYSAGVFSLKDSVLKAFSMLEYEVGGRIKNLMKQFTVEPIMTGLSEYETQINAIQTILANTESKGTTLDDVNTALDELNKYADKTIYNFTQMTKNIGTFTAAGVDLDTSVNAIKGIANLAAVSGSNAQQASTAMYQLSQALASGTVKLMDWNSVVNAGMGGQVFQDALKDTARVHNIAIDDMIESEGSFRETLSDGWLTAEILTETLEKFTMCKKDMTEAEYENARAMWKSKGYTDEQIDAIFKLGSTATSAATEIKTFSQLMDTLRETAQSGWTQTWEILVGDFEEAKNLWSGVYDILEDILNASAEVRNNLLQGWADGGGRDMLIESIGNLFEALMNIIEPIKEAFSEIFPPATADQLIEITRRIRDFTATLKLSDEVWVGLYKTFRGIFAAVKVAWDVLKAAAKVIWNVLESLGPLLAIIIDLCGYFGDLVTMFSDWVEETGIITKAADKLSGVLTYLVGIITNLFGGCVDVVKSFWDMGVGALSGNKHLAKFGDIVQSTSTAVGSLGGAIKEIFSAIGQSLSTLGFEKLRSVLEKLAEVLGVLLDQILGVASYLSDGLNETFDGSDGVNTLIKLLGLLLGVFLGFKVKNFIDGFKDIQEAIEGMFESISETFDSFSKYIQASALKKTAISVLMLAGAFLILAAVDTEKAKSALISMTVLLGGLIGALFAFSKIATIDKDARKAKSLMLVLSASVLILCLALKQISKLDIDKMWSATGSIVVLMGALTGAMALLGKVGGKTAKGIITMAAMLIAIEIMANICEKLSKIEVGSLWSSVGAVSVMMVVLTGMIALLGKVGGKVTKGILVMATMAFAISTLADICKELSTIEIESLWSSVGAISVMMVVLTGVIAALSAIKVNFVKLMGVAIAIIAFSGALTLMADALTKFNGVDWESVGKAAAVIGGLLVVLLGVGAIVSAYAPLMAGIIAVAAAFMMMGGAMALLGVGLKTIAEAFQITPYEDLALGLMAIGGALTVFALGASVAIALSPSLLILGAAFLALGLGLIAMSKAFELVSAEEMVAKLAILAEGFRQAIMDFIAWLPEATAALMVAVKSIIASLIDTITSQAPLIIACAINIIYLILDKIQEHAPEIIAKIFSIIHSCINALTSGISTIAKAIADGIVRLLNEITGYIPKITKAGADLVVALIKGILENLASVVDTAVDLVIAFCKGISDSVSKLVQAGWDLIIKFIDGMTDSIETNMPRLRAAVQRLFKAIITEGTKTLTSGLSSFKTVGGNLIDGLKSGITSKLSNLWGSVKGGFESFKNKFCNFFGIHSPSTVFAKFGEYMDEGLVVGLNHYSSKVSDSAEGVGKDAIKSMSNVISGVAGMVNSDINSQPTIRPVLDLSNIRNGANQINGMFGMHPSVGVMANVGSISSMMNRNQNGANADVISALKDLGSKLNNTSGNTYNINGVTYDDGSNIAEAIQTIVRAANIARRT